MSEQSTMWFVALSFIPIIVYIILCFVVASFAGKRGHSYAGFFLLSFFLSPIAGIIVALLMPANVSNIEQTQYQSGERRKCPFCAELVASEAKICKHCQRELPQAEPSQYISRGTVPCPVCAELVAPEDAICKNCQTVLNGQPAELPESPVVLHKPAIREPFSALELKRFKQAVLFVVFLIVAIFGYIIFEKIADERARQQYEAKQKQAEDAQEQARQTQIAAIDSVVAANMVRIPGKNYEIGKYEVTQAEWKAVMGNNPSNHKNCGDTCPVEQVSWNDIQTFLQKLNAKTGKQYRLPTEAEWEYACYGGSQSDYCGGNNVDAVAWYSDNSKGQIHPVGQKQVNGYGLYDMSGNVWERMQDCYYSSCNERAVRSGSYDNTPPTVDYRSGSSPASRVDDTGFRLAKTLP